MKYAISAGHNPSGKVGSGAVGFMDESKEARLVKDEVIRLLRSEGYIVTDCTVHDGLSAADALNKVIKKHANANANINISIHFNAFKQSPKDGKTKGVEVFTHNTSAVNDLADAICKKISSLGFTNRGRKEKNFAFLKMFKVTGMLVEVCFVDDADDVNLYRKLGVSAVAKAIVEGILGRSITIAKPTVKMDRLPDEPKEVMISLAIVKTGSKGEEVRTLQKLLSFMGYTGKDKKSVKVDGIAGPNTIFALSSYQIDEILTADGICGLKTWTRLLKG